MSAHVYYEVPELIRSGFQRIVILNLYFMGFDSGVDFCWGVNFFNQFSLIILCPNFKTRKVSNCAVGRIYSVTETTFVFGSLASSGLFKAAIS